MFVQMFKKSGWEIVMVLYYLQFFSLKSFIFDPFKLVWIFLPF